MKIESSNEIDLVRQTLEGDTSAFDRLVKIHRTTIYALVISYIKDPADAEDLTQRIFIRAYERLATLRELDRFRPWLLQIAHNTCKDWLRRRSDSTTRFEATNDIDCAKAVPSPEDIALKAEIEAVVRQAISALRETDRRLMEARYIEGADYDQLQVESGLSYAAIANRLKRAKREVRCRIEKLLGCVAILPGRTFILGGIEAVKLSAKVKLATVGVAAVIGIGGVVYHQAFESNPVAVNEQAISVANAVTEGSSTKVVDQTDTTLGNNSSMEGASIPTAGESNHFEIATDDRGEKPVKLETKDIKDIREVVRELLERRLSEEDLEMLQIEGIEDIAQVIEEILENRDDSSSDIITQVFETEHEFVEGRFFTITMEPNSLTEEELKQKVASGELTAIQVKSEGEGMPGEITLYMSEGTQLSEGLTERLQEIVNKRFPHSPTAGSTPSTSTESQPSAAHSVLTPSGPSVDSGTTPSEISEVSTQLSDEDWAEVEKLLSEFSDEDWAELARLLRDSAVEETPQRDEGAPLNPKPQRRIEETIEEPTIDPSVQEMQRQRGIPPESDTDVLPPKTHRNVGR